MFFSCSCSRASEANDKTRMKEQIERLEKQLEEVENMLGTKQTDMVNAETDVRHLDSQEGQALISLKECTQKFSKIF